MKRYLLSALLALAIPVLATAQTEIVKPNLSIPSLVAPDYFGPNAFPIPDMLDGTTIPNFKAEISTDYFAGRRGDKTYDVAFKFTAPLYSDRVNLTLWISSITEWYTHSQESFDHSRLPEGTEMKGQECGDAYLSTDLHLLKQTRTRPDISLRIALKTALGYGFFKARYYDTPGYFFDTSIAKSLKFDSPALRELRFAVSGGFLCWQTDNGRQNDAIMYGVQMKLRGEKYSFSQTFGGYSGWENAGDRPMSLKSELRILCGKIEPLAMFQYGLHDYPFTQVKLGVAYNF